MDSKTGNYLDESNTFVSHKLRLRLEEKLSSIGIDDGTGSGGVGGILLDVVLHLLADLAGLVTEELSSVTYAKSTHSLDVRISDHTRDTLDIVVVLPCVAND